MALKPCLPPTHLSTAKAKQGVSLYSSGTTTWVCRSQWLEAKSPQIYDAEELTVAFGRNVCCDARSACSIICGRDTSRDTTRSDAGGVLSSLVPQHKWLAEGNKKERKWQKRKEKLKGYGDDCLAELAFPS